MSEASRPTPDPADPADSADSADGGPALPAPEPVGEIVPGDPPVPITVWHLPAPRSGEVVPVNVTRRLAANYTHAGSAAVALVTSSPPSFVGGQRLELVVTTWPLAGVAATSHVEACAGRLVPDGCLAVVLANSDIPDQLGTLVGVARGTGLTYLQHVVVAHNLQPDPRAVHPGTVRARAARGDRGGPRHLRVHTDILIFRKRGHDTDD